MSFHNQERLSELYNQMKQKPYSKKEPWEKFLNDDWNKQRKKQKVIREHELLIDNIEHIQK